MKRRTYSQKMMLCATALLVLTLVAWGHAANAGYRNFDVAIYCTVFDVEKMADLKALDETFSLLQKPIAINKVYLETHRRNFLIDEKTLNGAIKFFESRGIKTSGGITPTGDQSIAGHFGVFCYTNDEHLSRLKEVVQFTAKHFDEIIIDDFYFTSCRCESCIREKGNRTWAEFRLDLMRDVSKDIVIKTAKETNPRCTIIIKYPNWYEFYQHTGYNLKDQPGLFDMIYTGTETRDPVYHQQHLQPYQGYLIMRYLENVSPGRNGGGWIDPLDMRFLNRYAEQLSLTLFAHADEVTLFHFGSLVEWIHEDGEKFVPLSINASVAGYVFEKTDLFLGKLGNPVGLPTYKPVNSSGEAFLPVYLGMLGLPMELTPNFPGNANTVLLTESAGDDPDLVEKMKDHLSGGKNLIITSGLLKALEGKGISDIISAKHSNKKCITDAFTDLGFSYIHHTKEKLVLPIIEFPTNDAWMETTAISGDNSYPMVLRGQYAGGLISVLTIPDNFADLYKLPEGALTQIKHLLLADFQIQLEAPPQVSLFLYDNSTFIVHSFLPHKTEITVRFKQGSGRLVDLISGEEVKVERIAEQLSYKTRIAPYSYRVFQWH